MNPQAQYGADVIMRANYGLEHGTEALSMCVREAVNEMLGRLAEEGVRSLAVCLTRRHFAVGKMADGQRKGKRKNYVL